MSANADRDGDRRILMLIGGGIVLIILCIIAAIAFARGMEEWAESVFSAIVGGAIVKLADVLSALVQLSSNRQVARMGDQLASAPPTMAAAAAAPQSAQEGADAAAQAAVDEAERIKGEG